MTFVLKLKGADKRNVVLDSLDEDDDDLDKDSKHAEGMAGEIELYLV